MRTMAASSGVARFAIMLSVAAMLAGCEQKRTAVAKRITSRAELIGGPGALGEVGDFLLANDQIRVIVQGEGFSRGFGLYGGALIDADLQRPGRASGSDGGQGFDNFSELFPSLFLQAMRPRTIEAVNNDDGTASVVVTGGADDFLFLASRINDLLVDGPALVFTNTYRLAPGDRHVEITTTVTNGSPSRRPIAFPTESAQALLGDTPFVFPVGDIVLFGAGNDVFAPEAGFDLRFTLERRLENAAAPPVLPGLVTPFLASRGTRVSYGFMSAETGPQASIISRTGTDGDPGDLVVPFVASAFIGVFHGAPPPTLPFGATYSYKKYFIVGDGDVASIRDVAVKLRGVSTSTVSGWVVDAGTTAPEAGAEIIVLDANGEPYNHHRTDSGGRFIGRYEPGQYRYVVLSDGRFPTASQAFEVRADRATFLPIRLPSPGEVAVRITDDAGQRIPGRCSLVGMYAVPMGTTPGRDFLYDLRFGERIRPLDLVPDTEDPATRRFIEEVIVAADGRRNQRVRPGPYRVYCSRGPEYSVFEQDIDVVSGGTATVDAVLARNLDTAGWASADFHLHSVNSVDSAMSVERRVAAVAAEGVDLAVSSDHNYITDYRQAIASQQLERFVQGMVGLELTTLESGHFNGFPLRFDPEPVTNGAFEWSRMPPQELFDALRARGTHGPTQTLVQVNHPRDSILGYFDNYNLNQDTGLPEDSEGLIAPSEDEFRATAFSFDFDAIEVFNGKRFELLRNQRVPDVLPPGVTSEDVGPAGSVYRTDDGDVGFAGGVDDWFSLLNRGRLFTATANSDSHGPDSEPGVPRTFIPVRDDRPGRIDEQDVVAALKTGRAIGTTGPIPLIRVESEAPCVEVRTGLELGTTTCGMGELARVTDGSARIEVEVRVPSWQPIDEVRFIVNSATVAVVVGDTESLRSIAQTVDIDQDGWLVVEVSGRRSLFPIVRPNEIPEIRVSAALESIVGAFGLGSILGGGPLPAPSGVGPVTSYAFTNPVFFDADGNGRYDPPRPLSEARRRPKTPESRPQTIESQSLILKMLSTFAHQH